MTTKHLWLDLEDTVITPVLEGWNNVWLINLDKLRHFQETFKPDFVSIFSFALWDEEQKKRFNLFVRPMLEKHVGPLSFVPTVEEIQLKACREVGISPESISFQDMSDFWGKQQAFRLFLRHQFKTSTSSTEHLFLDDAVFDEKFEWNKLTCQIINIDNFTL